MRERESEESINEKRSLIARAQHKIPMRMNHRKIELIFGEPGVVKQQNCNQDHVTCQSRAVSHCGGSEATL
jgi:hypothetical protein